MNLKLKNKTKNTYVFAAILFLVSAVFTAVVKFVDVQSIGPQNTSIGLAKINAFFRDLLNPYGVNEQWYKITKYLAVLAFVVIGIFALIGLIQLIQRRNLLKVDGEILSLGVLYIIILALYFLFDKIALNYRPFILPDEIAPEASFPSSHTMMICVVMGTAMIILPRVIKNGTLRLVLQILAAFIMALMIVGRFLSGVHWFTDIVAGILISAAFVTLYKAVYLTFSDMRKALKKQKN